MAGGQVLDLQLTGSGAQIAQLDHIHELKTGALIRFSVVAPAIIGQCKDPTTSALDRFGSCVGLGFQIRDDILDVTGDANQTGKLPHADALRNKPTYPAIVGLNASCMAAERLRDEALGCLQSLPGDTSGLAWLADYMINRNC